MNTPPPIPPEAPESLTRVTQPRTPSLFVSAIIALWRDRVFLFWLALALLANLALFAYLALRFDNLPDPLPMHFDSAGLPDRIESKNGIFALPIIGITIFVLNLGLGVVIHRRERAITILLTVGALFVQVLMWLAIINLAGLV